MKNFLCLSAYYLVIDIGGSPPKDSKWKDLPGKAFVENLVAIRKVFSTTIVVLFCWGFVRPCAVREQKLSPTPFRSLYQT